MEYLYICIIAAFVIGYFLGRKERQSEKLLVRVYEKYTQDMKDFATAYSELSVQFVNQHLPTAPPASFTQSIPSRRDGRDEDWETAKQPAYDDYDLAGGNNNL